jgi:hypothetical protein
VRPERKLPRNGRRRARICQHKLEQLAAGPVSRILSPREAEDGHSSRPRITAWLKRPTRDFHPVTGMPIGGLTRRAGACRDSVPTRGNTARQQPCSRARPLFGLAPCGVYPAPCITARAVRSYRTFSPLPRGWLHPTMRWAHGGTPIRGRYVFCGTGRRLGLTQASRTLSGTLLCGVRTFLFQGHAARRKPAFVDGSDRPIRLPTS